jgi:hypothetical protein
LAASVKTAAVKGVTVPDRVCFAVAENPVQPTSETTASVLASVKLMAMGGFAPWMTG